MPDLQNLLDQIQERSRTAGDHVARLCTKEDRWKMSVPAQDTDSDILLTQITERDVPQLAKAVQAVMEIHKPFNWSFAAGDQVYTITSCQECARLGADEEDTIYPCQTVQAIKEAMEGDDV